MVSRSQSVTQPVYKKVTETTEHWVQHYLVTRRLQKQQNAEYSTAWLQEGYRNNSTALHGYTKPVSHAACLQEGYINNSTLSTALHGYKKVTETTVHWVQHCMVTRRLQNQQYSTAWLQEASQSRSLFTRRLHKQQYTEYSTAWLQEGYRNNSTLSTALHGYKKVTESTVQHCMVTWKLQKQQFSKYNAERLQESYRINSLKSTIWMVTVKLPKQNSKVQRFKVSR